MLNTNGTLVTENIAKWFVDNDIPLRFSIDGTKAMHNKNRVFINGKGSYDKAIKGLSIYKKYYKKGFTVQSAIPHDNYIEAVHDIWKLGANMVLANPALESPYLKNTNFNMTKKDWKKYSKHIQYLNNEIIKKIFNDQVNFP